MKKGKNLPSTDSSTISTLLGRDTVFEGNLSFKETIRVDGQIKGKLISEGGTVIVGENAVLDADIQVCVAIIRGNVNGRVEASQRVEIYAPAQFNGDVFTPTLSMDSGVIFNGKCQMRNQASQAASVSRKALKDAIDETPAS